VNTNNIARIATIMWERPSSPLSRVRPTPASRASSWVKKHEVHDLKRRSRVFNIDRIDLRGQALFEGNRGVGPLHGDMADSSRRIRVALLAHPNGIDKPATQSRAAAPLEEPKSTPCSYAGGKP